jgi:phage FluMu gp28-like protein
LTPKVLELIIEGVELAMPYEAAARRAGINEKTFYNWKNRGEEIRDLIESAGPEGVELEEEEYRYFQFIQALDEANAQAMAAHLINLENHSAEIRPSPNGYWSGGSASPSPRRPSARKSRGQAGPASASPSPTGARSSSGAASRPTRPTRCSTMSWTPRTERAAFLVDFLDLPEAAQVEDAKWEHFQLAHLQDDNRLRIENKSRQIAWSFTTAAEAVADGILTGRGTLFQSINLQEAQEKIRYARNVIYALAADVRPTLLTENKQALEFDNGARLISIPGNPQRGKAQMNIVFDEWAHIMRDREVYTAALPIISKGDGRVRGGSSPLGASGIFWEIFKEELRPYPGFSRKETPWWEVQAFCTNVREAVRVAGAYSVEQMVDLFGKESVRLIYGNMLLEDFMQEYCCLFVDETTAWITWEEIRAAQDAELVCELSVSRDSKVDEAMAAVDRVVEHVRRHRVEQVLVAGVDIGRTRNTTELFILGISTLNSFPLRAAVTLDNCDFDSQEAVLRYALSVLPIVRMYIDQNGIGMQLAENVHKAFSAKAEGYQFSNANKQLLATEAKMLFQQGRTAIPADRQIAYQIHSIKKLVTPSKHNVYDTDRNEKHHADKFWALALGLMAASEIAKTGERRPGSAKYA